jgi:hypothetical protein
MKTRARNANQIAGRSAAVIVSLSLFFAGLAKAQMLISSCPYTIDRPGNYQLMQDLNCGSGEGIRINVPSPIIGPGPQYGTTGGVSLKLNGKIITAMSSTSGVDGGAAIHVVGPTDHVAIAGPGLIRNDPNNSANAFRAGVSLDRASYSQVSQVTILGSTIPGSATFGIAGYQCSFLTVASNIVGRIVGTGIFCRLCGATTITGNDSSGNDAGIGLEGDYTIALPGPNANPTVVNNNTANLNSDTGIDLYHFFFSTVRVYSNETNLNGALCSPTPDMPHTCLGGFGIRDNATGSADAPTVFFNNTSLGNRIADMEDKNNAPCQGDVWRNNTFLTRNQSCIY